MRILHVNLSDGTIGASIAAYRLHEALQEAGHDSRMLVWDRFSSDSNVQHIEHRRVWRLINRTIGIGLNELSLQYLYYPSSFRLLRHPWVQRADIINLHIIHGGYFSFTVLPWLSRQTPVVVTLHDMWLMTGHCAVASYIECDRWLTGCGRCPQLDDYPAIRWDMTALWWKLKRYIYSQSRMTLIAPSKWMASQAQRSPMLSKCPVFHIPNGVNLDVFRPLSRETARTILNVDPESLVVMFSADSLTKPRKGGRDLVAALSVVVNSLPVKPLLLLVGSGDVSEVGQGNLSGLFQVRHIGAVHDELLMRLCYSAADLVVLPTLADNLPSVLIEALACGTPAVSYAIGGVAEIIDHMQTGYVAQYRDVKDLAAGVILLLSDDQRRRLMSECATTRATERFGLQLQAQRYIDIYHRLTETDQRAFSSSHDALQPPGLKRQD